MSVGEELEAALQRGWDFGELEVYADHLLAKNDPRGDIVALDLSPRPEQATWVARRRTALVAWLGNSLAARAGHLIQHGFLHELRVGMYPADLLDSPAGTFVRGFTTWGVRPTSMRVRTSLEQLASKPRPWLSRLTIAHQNPGQLSNDLARALIAATPRLEEVCFYGRPVFTAFPHPNVSRVRVDARCSAIEIDAPKTLVEVPEGSPGPRIARADLELLMELVELAPDCNQLYTYGQEFDEPLPALIARLAAAQLVELAGPVVSAAATNMRLALGRRRLGIADLPQTRGWAGGVAIPNLYAHGVFLRSCLETLPVSPRMHDTLLEYIGAWARSTNAQRTKLDADLTARLRLAFNALFELRGLWPAELGTAEDWEQLEAFAREDGQGSIYLTRQYGYYWY